MGIESKEVVESFVRKLRLGKAFDDKLVVDVTSLEGLAFVESMVWEIELACMIEAKMVEIEEVWACWLFIFMGFLLLFLLRHERS